MANITKKDFSSGWRPSDDPINGDPNGLLQMDNVDLDTNGAISLIGGTTVVGAPFASNLHSIYSRMINGARVNYAADVAGGVFRGNTSIATGGSTTRAAFGSAFDFALVCSGDKRKKDNGTTAVDLGVGAPSAAPTFISADLLTDAPFQTWGSLLANTVMPIGSSAVITEANYPSGAHARPAPIQYLQITATAGGDAVIQTYAGGGPYNFNVMTSPYATDVGTGTDNDIIPFYGYVENPFGVSLQIDILLTAGNAFGDQMSNYYSYKIDDLSTLQFDSYTGVFYIYLKRSDFTRVGSGEQNWTTTYGFRITFKGQASQVINILGNAINPAVASVMQVFGGSHSQNGIYEFAQVNVNNTGTYLAKSTLGPSTGPITIISSQAFLQTQVPVDTQVNEVWVYARSAGGQNTIGGQSTLDQWYRVAKITGSLGTNFHVRLSDLLALTLDITYNQNLVSIASSSIADPILAILGPINSRWYYFTKNLLYPSDINDPDLVDASEAIRTTGSNNESFMWAQQVDKATVLVGTSVDVYVLSGTFATLPDYTIDIFYHGLGCKYPPIAIDSDVWAGNVYYMANDGWRIINASNQNPLSVAPELDTLYRGISSYGYTAPNLKVPVGSVRFPVVVARNKLWCFVTGTGRCEVFDFIRKYWRTFNYGLGDVTAACGTQDGQVLALYSNDKKLREVDVKSTKLIDGTTKQTFKLLWTVQDGGTPRQRKDSQTFKIRCYSGTSSFLVSITNELNAVGSPGTLTSIGKGIDKYLDLSQVANLSICKTYQLSLIGLVDDLLIEDWSIDYTLRPEQVSYVKALNTNFNNGNKKRVRNWPVEIDTLGNQVLYTPYVDNVAFTPTTLQSADKTTENIFFTDDVFGVDYGYTLYCSNGLFEHYGPLSPSIVQVLPIAKRLDQVGPEEFFKYGKIKQLELRVLPLGTYIPYTIFMSDSIKRSGAILVTYGVENSYFIDMPKGTSGRIVRIVFGPTIFDFHRFYVRLQVADAGKDTELNWITIANE